MKSKTSLLLIFIIIIGSIFVACSNVSIKEKTIREVLTKIYTCPSSEYTEFSKKTVSETISQESRLEYYKKQYDNYFTEKEFDRFIGYLYTDKYQLMSTLDKWTSSIKDVKLNTSDGDKYRYTGVVEVKSNIDKNKIALIDISGAIEFDENSKIRWTTVSDNFDKYLVKTYSSNSPE